jgi:acyl-CoA synthetase (NDP forming)
MGPGTSREAIEALFRPRSIALLGASDRAGSRGAELIANLRSIGYAGTIYPVNPRHASVAGVACYATLRDLPEAPDMVAIGIPKADVLEAVETCATIGARAVGIVGAGYAEAGSAGAALQGRIADVCRSAGIALSGPNCLGVWSRIDHVAYWLAGGNSLSLTGLGLIIQSGALASSIMDPLGRRGLAFDVISTTGNEAVVTASDYMSHMLSDDRIHALGIVIEGFRDPDGFIRAAEAAAKLGKPVVCLKLGRSEGGQRAALAHTASLAGSADATRAVLRQVGVRQVRDLDELLEAMTLLARYPSGLGQGIVFMSVSGAACGLIADLADDAGMRPVVLSRATTAAISDLMPDVSVGNPLDVALAGDRPGLFRACVEVVVRDPVVDTVVIALNVPHAETADGTAFYLDQVSAGAAVVAAGKSCLALTLTSGELDPKVVAACREMGIPLLQGLAPAMAAIVAARSPGRDARRNLLTANLQTDSAPTPLPPLGPGETTYSEPVSKALLAEFDIPVVEERIAASPDEAVQLARQIGFPVVLKIHAPNLPHKTDAGGVRLGLTNGRAVRSAYEAILRSVRARRPDADVRGALVQAMVGPGVEVILGMKRDATFGPLVLVGLGGTWVEIQRDFALRRPPIDEPEALRMIDSLQGAALLHGARGGAPADLEALCRCVAAFSRLVAAHGRRLEAIDVNPLIVLPHGCVAVDALVVPRAGNERED